MKSVKLHEDTLAAIRAVKVRNGCSYDEAVMSILRKQAEAVEPLLNCAAQLDRIEVSLTELKDQFLSQPKTRAKSGGEFLIE
jgi:hypothetical protein